MDKKKKRKLFEEDNGFAQFGGYMTAKKSKLAEQFNSTTQSSRKVSNIFDGVSIFVNGYTNPSALELKSLISQHGGVYHHYYSRTRTTHIIANVLPHCKVKNLKDEKVVKPEWIVDSIQAGKLLPHNKFLLYNPGVLQGQSKLGFPTESDSSTYATSTSTNIFGQGRDTCAGDINENTTISSKTPHKSNCINGSLNDSNSDRLSDARNSPELFKDKVNTIGDLEKETSLEKTETMPKPSNGAEICVNFLSEDPVPIQEHLVVVPKSPDRLVYSNEESGQSVNSDRDVKIDSITPCLSDQENESSRRAAGKAGDSNFLSEFYSHSRLHHISTAGSEFKDFVRQLQTDHQGNFPGREILINEVQIKNSVTQGATKLSHKVFMHIDMDCFFVSVGLLKRPDLIGKPVAVTHSRGNAVPQRAGVDAQYELNYYQQKRYKGRDFKLSENKSHPEEERPNIQSVPVQTSLSLGSTSEISSCSYEARKAGVSSGMFLGEALKLCPDLQTIPYDFEGYKKASRTLYETLASYTLHIEAISCDEMFVDCTEILESTGVSPSTFAELLRTQIYMKTGCTASAGLGSNLLIARLATRFAKPNGLKYVPKDDNSSFMMSQFVKDLPGVGNSLGAHLKSLGVHDCKQLQGLMLEKLQKEFGPKTGKTLYEQCRGIDHRIVITEKERKTVSAEINYGMRFQKIDEAENFLKELSEEVEKRLKNAGKIGSHITLKLKIRSKDAPVETAKFLGHGVCDNIARSVHLTLPTDLGQVIAKECCSALRTMKVVASDIRGMGIQVTRLSSTKTKQNVRTLENFILNQPSTSKMSEPKQNSEDRSKKVLNSAITTPIPSESSLSKEWFPSPSQIDPEVWQSLPKHIQSQLASEYHALGTKVNQGKVTTGAGSYHKQALPHYSQLDSSVMDALPDDIRHELLEAYSNQDQKRSPVKGKSKTSPAKSPNPKRGRKKKLPQASPVKKFQVLNKVQSPVKPAPITSNPKKESFKASLCGSVELEHVRLLIKEWILSTPYPLDDDIQLFVQYVRDLTQERNLEKLDLIIKCLYRNICESKNKDWEEVYLRIIEDMQPNVKQLYGFCLRVQYFK